MRMGVKLELSCAILALLCAKQTMRNDATTKLVVIFVRVGAYIELQLKWYKFKLTNDRHKLLDWQ